MQLFCIPLIKLNITKIIQKHLPIAGFLALPRPAARPTVCRAFSGLFGWNPYLRSKFGAGDAIISEITMKQTVSSYPFN